MMELKLYYTRSSNNTINKVLEGEQLFNIHFKDIANVLTPEIKLKGLRDTKVNYAYVPDFGKYYFVRNIEIFPNNITTIKLETDVLETYKDDILNSEGTVSRSKFSNEYFDGGDYRSEERREHKLYHSDVKLNLDTSTILVTIGG